jgi:hypothetical protein
VPRSVARAGLLTFAALATVALIIGLALSKPPAQEQASLAPDGPAPTAPPVDAAPDLAPAPPQDAAPAPSPPAEDSTPAPPEDAAPAPTPPAEDPAPAPTAEPPAEDTPPAPETAPVSTPALDVDAAADYVRAFYADLGQRRFKEAWPRLAEDLRASYSSFETWERGFDTTLRQSVSDLVATAAGPATVRVSLTLTAVDRDKHDCEVTRRFAVEWRLDFMGGKWRALHAEGKALESAPTGVAASCSAQPPAQMSQSEN